MTDNSHFFQNWQPQTIFFQNWGQQIIPSFKIDRRQTILLLELTKIPLFQNLFKIFFLRNRYYFLQQFKIVDVKISTCLWKWKLASPFNTVSLGKLLFLFLGSSYTSTSSSVTSSMAEEEPQRIITYLVNDWNTLHSKYFPSSTPVKNCKETSLSLSTADSCFKE